MDLSQFINPLELEKTSVANFKTLYDAQPEVLGFKKNVIDFKASSFKMWYNPINPIKGSSFAICKTIPFESVLSCLLGGMNVNGLLALLGQEPADDESGLIESLKDFLNSKLQEEQSLVFNPSGNPAFFFLVKETSGKETEYTATQFFSFIDVFSLLEAITKTQETHEQAQEAQEETQTEEKNTIE